MVFLASISSPSCSPLIGTVKNQACRLHSSLPRYVHSNRVSFACSAKLPRMQLFEDPSSKVIVGLNYTKEKLWEFVPGSVKQFPWKKAESVALQEVVVLGKEALKWTLIACFAFSFLSDFIYSISSNKELVIPFGLFVGCLMANYLDEISQEFMLRDKDGNNAWRLVGVACFFVLMKIISTYFSGWRYFLLHAANGGLMQVIWKWNKLPRQGDEYLLELEDVSNPMSTSE